MGQSKSACQSHLKPEAADNKNHPLGSCRQQESSTRINSGKRNEDKELILRLTTENQEQQNTRDELSSTVMEFLRVQSTVKKLQGNIEKLSKQTGIPGKIQSPTFDQSPNSHTLYTKEFCRHACGTRKSQQSICHPKVNIFWQC